MNYLQKQVWGVVKITAPKFVLDPKIVMGINEQECDHPNDDVTIYDPSIARLEEGFHYKYVERGKYSRLMQSYGTTTRILLASSYGTMQVMGLSLWEDKNEDGLNYFEQWFKDQPEGVWKSTALVDPMSVISVDLALNDFCVNLGTMVEWGCRHLAGKIKAAGGDVAAGIDDYNGDQTGAYRNQMMNRVKRMEREGLFNV